jgi:hypothetical protein
MYRDNDFGYKFAANRRLAQWQVKWLSQMQRFNRECVQVDNLVLLSPRLRQAPKR